MIDGSGKIALIILTIAWDIMFMLLFRRLNAISDDARASALDPYQRLHDSRSDVVIISGDGRAPGFWMSLTFLQCCFSGMSLIMLVGPLSVNMALFWFFFSCLFFPIILLFTIFYEAIDVVSDIGIERAWVFRKKRPLFISWQSVLRVSKFHHMRGWSIKIKYHGGTIFVQSIINSEALAGSILRFVPPYRRDEIITKTMQKWLNNKSGDTK